MKKFLKVLFLSLAIAVFLSSAMSVFALNSVADSSEPAQTPGTAEDPGEIGEPAGEPDPVTGYVSQAFEYPERTLPLLVDDADLLTPNEEAQLLQKLEEITQRQQCEISVVTKYSIDGKLPRDYADDFFDYNGYGWGADHDGLMLLISMEERDYYVSGHGDFAAYSFIDAIDYISEQFVPYLSDGDYYGAFTTYADTCDDLITRARQGNPYNPQEPVERGEEGFPVGAAAAGGGLGSLLGFLPVSAMKSKLKTVRHQPSANTYIRPNSLDLRISDDAFLYSQVTRVPRPTNEGRTGGGGGGFHISSSGSSHFGGGGKF